MSEGESSNARADRAPPTRFLSVRHSVEEIKWMDVNLCRMLFFTNPEWYPHYLDRSRLYYDSTEELFRSLSSRVNPASAQAPISCLIITPCRCPRTPNYRVTRYKCQLPVLQSLPSTRLCLDVSSDVPNFSDQWNPFFSAAGGTVLDTCERPVEVEREGGGEGRVQLSDYDSVILYLDYPDFEHRECKHRDALANGLTSSQTLVVTGTKWQTSEAYSNLDCMHEMFKAVNGFYFLPFCKLYDSWRIWCNRQQNNWRTNLMEIVHWACLYAILRRSRALSA